MEDLKAAVAGAFRARGKARLTRSEIVFALALDLKWFSQEESKEAVEFAIRAGLLKEEAGKLTPTFDYRTEAMNRRPGPGPGVFSTPLIDRITVTLVHTGIEAAAVPGLVSDKQNALCGLVTPEAAALIIAKERGVDVIVYIDEAMELLKMRQA